MRLGLAALAFVLSVAVITSAEAAAAAPIFKPGDPQYANKLLSDFSTPTVSPGSTIDFGFNLTNPYENRTMTHIVVALGIYRYATQETAEDVDSNFSHPPLIGGLSTGINMSRSDMAPGKTSRLDLSIETTSKTPHGSYFSQATYFVRIKVTFNFVGNATPVVMQSRGWFNDTEWAKIVRFSSNQSIVDTSELRRLGVDGLIPDSSFGIRVPTPIWPLSVIIFACAGSAFMGLYYYVLDNPNKYPRLEKRFYQLRGKLSELRGKFQHRR